MSPRSRLHGAALRGYGSGLALAGINTFTEGYAGLFGDTDGGVVLDPHWGWISARHVSADQP